MSLKHKRQEVGLTQFELAKLSGVMYSRLAYSESGRTKLTPDEIRKLKTTLAEYATRKISTLATLARVAHA